MSKYDIQLNIDVDNSHSKILRKILPNSVVLEFGPAHGVMTRYMKEVLACEIYAVELDENSARDSGKYCKQIIVDSIEEYSWMQTYKNIKFDFILFADVLEHLYDPWRVLSEVLKFLKPDGRVLISLPNIAHNSIIMNLIDDKFEYRSTGLLDNTHIRFFTKQSIDDMVNKCGYKVIESSSINISPEYTEFKRSYIDFNDGVVNALQSKKNGHVYQYIYDIANIDSSLKEFQESNLDKVVPKYPENSHMQLFYYQNDEINVPDVRTQYFADENQTKFSFDLAHLENLTHIRIDLTNFPVMANLEYVKLIVADGSEHIVQPCYSNASLIEGNSYTYLHNDPINVYYLTPLNLVEIVRVEIAVDLQPIKRSEIFELANQITAKQNERIQQLDTQYQQQLTALQNQLHTVQGELTATNERLNNIQDELTAVYQSQSWKITKPLRKFCKLFKG